MFQVKPMLVGALAVSIAGTSFISAQINAKEAPAWSPVASERLVKLPGDSLRKSVDIDFARSALAAAMIDLSGKIRLKRQTLIDLQGAIDRSEGALRVDLQHQFLEEKRRYINLMQEHQEMHRRRAETKVRLYERLLSKLNKSRRAATPQQAALLAKQNAARERFASSVATVDAKLLQSAITQESRYAREYARNLAAIESLVAAVNAHPMKRAPQRNGQVMRRDEYLRQLIADNEADLAIIDQERSILGYMAKLVSLDALALTEKIQANDKNATGTRNSTKAENVASAVELFVQR